MEREFGIDKAVLANQDDANTTALPITLDASVYTLETAVVDGRTIAKAGSIVKEGAVVRGLLDQSYDITDGPREARIVLEGYVYASRLTPNALAGVSALPKIVVLPYKATIVRIDEVRGLVINLAIEGAKFASTAAIAHFTVAGGTVSSVIVASDGSSAILTFAAEGDIKLTAINADAITGGTGNTLKGLPLEVTLVKGEAHAVNVTAGSNGTAVSDKETASEGEIVSITATPSSGYVVDTVEVDEVELTVSGGKYKFVMPNHEVYVVATFKAQ